MGIKELDGLTINLCYLVTVSVYLFNANFGVKVKAFVGKVLTAVYDKIVKDETIEKAE